MKFIIETVYHNVDQQWLDWYLKRLGDEEVLSGSTSIVEAVRKYGSASFTSKDPSSDVVGVTTYKMIRTLSS